MENLDEIFALLFVKGRTLLLFLRSCLISHSRILHVDFDNVDIAKISLFLRLIRHDFTVTQKAMFDPGEGDLIFPTR